MQQKMYFNIGGLFCLFVFTYNRKKLHTHKSNPTGYSERVSQAYSLRQDSNLQDCLLSLFGKVYSVVTGVSLFKKRSTSICKLAVMCSQLDQITSPILDDIIKMWAFKNL